MYNPALSVELLVGSEQYADAKADARRRCGVAKVSPSVSDLVPVSQAADIVGVHPRTILKRIEEGKLVAQRMGARTLMVLRSSAEEYASTVSNRSKRKRAEAASAATKKQQRPAKGR